MVGSFGRSHLLIFSFPRLDNLLTFFTRPRDKLFIMDRLERFLTIVCLMLLSVHGTLWFIANKIPPSPGYAIACIRAERRTLPPQVEEATKRFLLRGSSSFSSFSRRRLDQIVSILLCICLTFDFRFLNFSYPDIPSLSL